MMNILKKSFGSCLFLALTACSPSFEGMSVLPDDLSVEGEEAPALEAVSPNLPILNKFYEPQYSKAEAESILKKYEYLDQDKQIPEDLLKQAILYYDANRINIPNKNFIGIVDFAAHSSLKRFFILNMASGDVWPVHVAHGAGSDENNNGLLNTFSNIEGSKQTSRGYSLTAEVYYGKYGRSLRLDGLSATNSKMRVRAVVLHGANYVQDKYIQQGRSWGCLAVPMPYKERIIDLLANGALIYSELSAEHWSDDR